MTALKDKLYKEMEHVLDAHHILGSKEMAKVALMYVMSHKD